MNFVDLWAGDDWQLNFTLLNADGSPFNLSGNPQLLWTLLDRLNHRLIQSNEVTYSITNAVAGQFSVLVPDTVTTRLQAAICMHALRVISGGVTATPFNGQINVLVDPWAVAPVQAQTHVVDLTARLQRAGVDRAAGQGRVG
jgi:hypothetical protein